MWRPRKSLFQVLRRNRPIRESHIKGSVNPRITSSIVFTLWEAGVAAGATLEELIRLDAGVYGNKFSARLIAWHNLHILVDINQKDAVNRASETK